MTTQGYLECLSVVDASTGVTVNLVRPLPVLEQLCLPFHQPTHRWWGTPDENSTQAYPYICQPKAADGCVVGLEDGHLTWATPPNEDSVLDAIIPDPSRGLVAA